MKANHYYQRGIFTNQTSGDLNKIKNYFKAAIDLDPSFYDYFYQLAILDHDLGNLEMAKKNYLNALSISNFDFNLVNDYGILLIEMNDSKFDEWKQIAEFIFGKKNEK